MINENSLKTLPILQKMAKMQSQVDNKDTKSDEGKFVRIFWLLMQTVAS